MKKIYPFNLLVLTFFLLLTNSVFSKVTIINKEIIKKSKNVLPPSTTLAASLTPFSTCKGMASLPKVFQVSGLNLTSSINISISNSSYELSLDGTTYNNATSTSPLTLTYASTVSATNIYIRLKSTAIAAPICVITCTSTGASSKTATISAGNVNTAVGGSIIGATKICSGTNVTLTLKDYSASTITSWISSTDNFTNPANTTIHNNNSTSFTAYNFTTNTSYKANLSCVTTAGTTTATSSLIQISVGISTEYDGSSWSNNGESETVREVTFSGDYPINSDFNACSIRIINSKTVTVNSGNNVNLTGSLIVESGSKFILRNNSNLIQENPDAVNVGDIEVNRESAPIVRLDHTLWSSPVTNQNLRAFSTNTLPYRFYTYNTSTNLYDSSEITDATVFSPTKGYAIRAPNNYQSTPALEWNGKFTGVPNNGTLTFPLAYVSDTINYNLVGNPYPSALSGDLLYAYNADSIFGTFYFYQHTLTMDTSGLFEEGTNYATWTPEGGGVAATVGTNAAIAIPPSGIIQVGQGFMVQSKSTENLIFSNDMRTADTNNQFIKSSSSNVTTEKHRMWLNLKTDTGTDLNQILVGYVTGATEGVDDGYDGLAYGNTGSSIYSLINAHNYTIQCRSLPFVTSDEVALGFKCATAGTYSIQLTSVDGLFNGNQDIFIRDNLTGTDTNIKVAPFTFTSAAGTFDNRFKIVYNQALGVPSTTFNENSVIVYKNTDWFHVSTKGISMKDILVYDISGRLIYKLNDINDTTAVLKGLTATKQVLFLKITSTENQSVTIKVLN